MKEPAAAIAVAVSAEIAGLAGIVPRDKAAEIADRAGIVLADRALKALAGRAPVDLAAAGRAAIVAVAEIAADAASNAAAAGLARGVLNCRRCRRST